MNNALRILMVNYEFPPIGGGAGNANLHILKEMAALGGVRIDLLTSFAGKGVVVEDFATSVRIYKVGIEKRNLHHWRKFEVINWMIGASKVYSRLLKENTYDLAHCFFAFPSGWFCWKSRKKLPYIISLRGSDVPGYNDTLGVEYFLLSGLFRRIWNNASSVTANSQGLAAMAKKFMPSLAIDVIPNGVDIDAYRQKPSDFMSGGKLRLLTVGRLVRRKQIDCIINSLPLLLAKGIDVRLDIAGDGVLACELKSLAQSIGVSQRVNFMGVVEKKDMPEVYASSDVFIMCSRHEGMSNAMLEAMAAALPIITAPCEGVEELIDGNGIILDECPLERSIANAVERLAFNHSLAALMAEKSRQIAMRFSWRSVALAYIKKYETYTDGKYN